MPSASSFRAIARFACLILASASPAGGCGPKDDRPEPHTDLDGDGFEREDDCNDADGAINPNADDVCDGVDNDCDGIVDWSRSTETESCSPPDAAEDASSFEDPSIEDPTSDDARSGDSTPDDSASDPPLDAGEDGPEILDGLPDEPGGDMDVLPEADSPDTDETDSDGDGYSLESGDCNDADATVYPGRDESCDGLDNNCDGEIDEPWPDIGVFGTCDGTDSDLCMNGYPTCLPDGTDAFCDEHESYSESCTNGVDDDCDGDTDCDDSECDVYPSCDLVTWTDDVSPILRRRCSPCHVSGRSGGHNGATDYDDTQLPSYHCPGQTKGACFLERVLDGSMPMGRGCTGDPVVDASDPDCLTAEEIQTLADWINLGQRR